MEGIYEVSLPLQWITLALMFIIGVGIPFLAFGAKRMLAHLDSELQASKEQSKENQRLITSMNNDLRREIRGIDVRVTTLEARQRDVDRIEKGLEDFKQFIRTELSALAKQINQKQDK